MEEYRVQEDQVTKLIVVLAIMGINRAVLHRRRPLEEVRRLLHRHRHPVGPTQVPRMARRDLAIIVSKVEANMDRNTLTISRAQPTVMTETITWTSMTNTTNTTPRGITTPIIVITRVVT